MRRHGGQPARVRRRLQPRLLGPREHLPAGRAARPGSSRRARRGSTTIIAFSELGDFIDVSGPHLLDRACSSGSGSRSSPTSTPTSCSSTRCSPSATRPFRPSAWPASTSGSPPARPSCSSPTTPRAIERRLRARRRPRRRPGPLRRTDRGGDRLLPRADRDGRGSAAAVTSPEDALDRAREALRAAARGRRLSGRAAARRRPRRPPSRGASCSSGRSSSPTPHVLRSTRAHGAPITAAKRLLRRALGQYHGELIANQTRFNLTLLAHLERIEARMEALEAPRPGDETPRSVIVHQLLSGAGPRDAITAEAPAFRARFDRLGLGRRRPSPPGSPRAWTPRFRPAGRAARRRHDVVLDPPFRRRCPSLAELLACPGRRLLLHHNVTPARWLWDVLAGGRCALRAGREQLPALVAALPSRRGRLGLQRGRAGGARAPRAPRCCRCSSISPRWGAPGRRGARRRGAPHVLFVGRLSPHKRQDRVIEAFALYRRVRAPRRAADPRR